MKILIVNTLYSPYQIGGAEVSVQLLAEGLVAQGMTVRVVCLHEGKTRHTDSINGVDVVYLPLRNIYWPFNGVHHLKFSRLLWHLIDLYNPMMKKLIDSELNDFNPDIVHTNNLAGFSVAIWSSVKEHQIKLIHTMRDYYLFHPNSTLFKQGKNIALNNFGVQIWSWIKRKNSKHVDVAVGISQYISTLHQDYGFFNQARQVYIYNPVNKPNFTVREHKNLRVGFIGRLSADKGFDQFCDIAKKYKNRGINFIAAGRFGNDKEVDTLKRRATNSGMTLLGFTKLENFLSEVDVVVLPVKWREPFGRTIVECALAGKVVYTNALGGISELLSFFGNVKPMAEIDEIGGFLYKEKIDNKFELQCENVFSVSLSIKSYLAAYCICSKVNNDLENYE